MTNATAATAPADRLQLHVRHEATGFATRSTPSKSSLLQQGARQPTSPFAVSNQNRRRTLPEIVEVEKLKLQLAPAWAGHTIMRWSAPPHSPNPRKYYQGDWQEFRRATRGATIRGVNRLGKNLIVHLSRPARPNEPGGTWHIHLSSTGWWMPGNEAAQADCQTDPIHQNFLHSISDKNVRVRMTLSGGALWNYHDPRTWGKWRLSGASTLLYEHLEHNGPDWLYREALATQTLQQHEERGKKTTKDVLTDQHITSGLGNYLACEILHRARIHPHREWRTLAQTEKNRLVAEIPPFLDECLKSNDHSHWRVFKRAGQPCPTCSTPITYVKDGGKDAARGSYLCAHCQPPNSARSATDHGSARAENR